MTGRDPDGPRRRLDRRSRAERRVRAAWQRGPGALLATASALYRTGMELRNAAWDLGILRPERAPIPVVSVGGLTVGGSGKTPLTAVLARRMSDRRRVGIVTHGFRDEMRLHRVLNPEAVVEGGRRRREAVEAVAEAGARLAVVDGGFQHRALWRDADVVAVSAREAAGGARALPAGPYREGWSALGRAEAVVVVRRSGSEERAERLARWLDGRLDGTWVARCALRPAGLCPFNDAARDVDRPDPGVAVASIMYPEVFLAQLREAGVRARAEVVLSDHAGVDASVARRVTNAAGDRGVVGTLKDVVKLESALCGDLPLWYLEEELRWEAGEEGLVARLEASIDRRRGPGSADVAGARAAGTRA